MTSVDLSGVYSRISDVDSSSRSRDNQLESHIRQLDSDLRQVDGKVDRNHHEVLRHIARLDEEVRKLETTLRELMGLVRTSFDKLQAEARSLRETTEASGQALKGEVALQGDRTSTGLQKVYSGAALTDVLAVQGEASKTEITIRRAVDERAGRLVQARKALEEKQEVFDKQFALVEDGFNKQLQVIAQHIVTLQEHLNQQLAELSQERNAEGLAAAEAQAGQRAAERWRREALAEELEHIDFSGIEKLRELTTTLSQFFADGSLAWREPSTVPDMDGVTLPFVGVSTNGEERLRVFCGGVHAETAYAEPKNGALSGLHDRVAEVARGWRRNDAPRVSDAMLRDINTHLATLVEAKVLAAEDAEAMREHLRVYPLANLSGLQGAH